MDNIDAHRASGAPHCKPTPRRAESLVVDDRYFTDTGELTADGVDAGRWLDSQHRSGDIVWSTAATDLEVHIQTAKHLHRQYIERCDALAAAAQLDLF